MTVMARRLARLLIALLLAAAVAPAGALMPGGAFADGDPASDMLLVQRVFYPFQPAVSNALQSTLNAETAAAAKAGAPIRVAIIASPADLGAIPSLFGKPQAYANFLDREISFNGPVPLLVVMAAGYGVQGLPAAATALRSFPLPSGRTSNDLAQAAVAAVAKMADASGHPIRVPTTGAAATGQGNSTVTIAIGLVLTAGVLAAAILKLRRQLAQGRRPPAPGRARRF